MIVHLISRGNRVYNVPFIEMVKKNFSNQIFIVYGDKQVDYPIDGVLFSNEISDTIFRKYIKMADKIILHSMVEPNYLVKLLMTRRSVRKTYWVVWGGDLHLKETHKGLKYKAYDLFKGLLIRRLAGICTLVPGDYELAVKWYKTKALYYEALYLPDIKMIEKASKLTIKPIDTTLKIIVGNSATESNNHIEVFKLLKDIDGNFEVFCPLSYGDMKYRSLVVEAGKRAFGNRFHALLDLLPEGEFVEFLNSMDIGVFNNNRQQGLGNIYYLLILKKAIFMREGTEMWSKLVLNDKYDIKPLEQIKFYLQNERELTSIEVEYNRKKILERISEKHFLSVWKKVFE